MKATYYYDPKVRYENGMYYVGLYMYFMGEVTLLTNLAKADYGFIMNCAHNTTQVLNNRYSHVKIYKIFKHKKYMKELFED